MKQARATQPLIPRSVGDDNFIHTLSLFPYIRLWAEALEPDYEITFNDRNMIQIPVELLGALMRERAEVNDPIGQACKAALERADEVKALVARPARKGKRGKRQKGTNENLFPSAA